jgi:cobalt-zinc-cadmium efflux system protein
LSYHVHAENRAQAEDRSISRLGWVLTLTVGFFFVELVGGFLSNSLALLSDAGHMFSDVSALTLALVAMRQAHRPPDAKRSFGYRRLEVVSALANGALLCGVAVVVAVEGARRLVEPPEIRSGLMLVVAGVGLGVNLFGIFLLHGGSKTSLGIRGAFLHLVGDALGSLGAVTAAVVIGLTGWTKIDALVSFLIAALILFSGGHLIRESLHVLLEGVPRHIRLREVAASLQQIDGIEGVHDLHVWRIGSGFDTLSVHLVVREEADWGKVKEAARSVLRERYGIDHCTLETESPAEHPDGTHPGTICDSDNG